MMAKRQDTARNKMAKQFSPLFNKEKIISFPLFLRGEKGVFFPSVQNKGERRTPPAPSYEEGENRKISPIMKRGE